MKLRPIIMLLALVDGIAFAMLISAIAKLSV